MAHFAGRMPSAHRAHAHEIACCAAVRPSLTSITRAGLRGADLRGTDPSSANLGGGTTHATLWEATEVSWLPASPSPRVLPSMR